MGQHSHYGFGAVVPTYGDHAPSTRKEAANLFIPFEVRNKVEQLRRDLETRARGTYSGPPEMVKLFENIDANLLDLLEIINLILTETEINTGTP